MRPALGYALACAALVFVTALPLGFWLGEDRLEGLLAAGAVSLTLQVPAFALLVWARERTNRFLVVWVGGTLVRFTAVGVVAWFIYRTGELDPLTTLLGLAAYLFGMLLLEPVFFRAASGAWTTNGAR